MKTKLTIPVLSLCAGMIFSGAVQAQQDVPDTATVRTSLEKVRNEYSDLMTQLEQTLAEAKTQLNEKIALKAQVEEHVKAAEGQIQQMTTVFNERTQQLASLQSRLDDVEQKFDETKYKIDELVNAAQTRTMLEQRDLKITTQEQVIAGLNQDIQAVQATIEEKTVALKQQVFDLASQLTEKEDQVSAMELEKVQLIQDVQERDDKLSRQNELISALKLKIAEFSTEQNKGMQQVNSLVSDFESFLREKNSILETPVQP